MNNSKSLKSVAWGVAVLRIAVGMVFLAHGAQKVFVYGLHGTAQAFGQMGIPLAAVVGPAIALLEFVGGMALVFGVFSRAAALLLAFNMAGAILTVHLKNGFFLPKGFEYAFTLLAANIGLALAGPGALAVENVFSRAKSEAFQSKATQAA